MFYQEKEQLLSIRRPFRFMIQLKAKKKHVRPISIFVMNHVSQTVRAFDLTYYKGRRQKLRPQKESPRWFIPIFGLSQLGRILWEVSRHWNTIHSKRMQCTVGREENYCIFHLWEYEICKPFSNGFSLCRTNCKPYWLIRINETQFVVPQWKYQIFQHLKPIVY